MTTKRKGARLAMLATLLVSSVVESADALTIDVTLMHIADAASSGSGTFKRTASTAARLV